MRHSISCYELSTFPSRKIYYGNTVRNAFFVCKTFVFLFVIMWKVIICNKFYFIFQFVTQKLNSHGAHECVEWVSEHHRHCRESWQASGTYSPLQQGRCQIPSCHAETRLASLNNFLFIHSSFLNHFYVFSLSLI